MPGACLDAVPALVNVRCNCCVVADGGALDGGSLCAGVGGRSWIACLACNPVGGAAPQSWESCSNATNWSSGRSNNIDGPPISS